MRLQHISFVGVLVGFLGEDDMGFDCRCGLKRQLPKIGVRFFKMLELQRFSYFDLALSELWER